MAVIGFVLHQHRREAAELAREVIDWLESRGGRARLPEPDSLIVGRHDLAVPDAAFAEDLALAVSIGGDGTMLRTVHLVVEHGVPVMGVHAGQLGYLTDVEPRDLRGAISAFLSGAYQLEERMLVAASAAGDGADTAVIGHALNEVVVEKTPSGHTVRLAVGIDGEYFHTYPTDGLIVATPTGSTAYSFSARGPIVAPDHRALVLTPVAPHSVFDRAMVLRPDTVVRIEVAGHRPATVSIDGRNLGTLTVGSSVVCTASERVARLVTFEPRNFPSILKAKFGLNDGRGDEG